VSTQPPPGFLAHLAPLLDHYGYLALIWAPPVARAEGPAIPIVG
jgi:hypothetical protein